MGKKKKASGKHYVSKGERPNFQRSIVKSVRRDITQIDRLDDIMRAWQRFQNPWVTISNPNTKETNKRRIRVRANDLFGDPKAQYRIAVGNTE